MVGALAAKIVTLTGRATCLAQGYLDSAAHSGTVSYLGAYGGLQRVIRPSALPIRPL